jgi:hypothetical protein
MRGMVMSLITLDSLYNFEFFTEKAFYKEQAANYVTDFYMDYIEHYNAMAASPEEISMSARYLYLLGSFARIHHLGEEYDNSFFDATSINEAALFFIEKNKADLATAVEEFQENVFMYPSNEQWRQAFARDIDNILSARKVFYMPVNTLRHTVLRNFPLKEVW